MNLRRPAERFSIALYFSLVAGALCTGCSPAQIRLEKQDLARLQTTPKFTVVTYAPAPFSVMTPEHFFATAAAAGAVGVLTGGLGSALVGAHAESRAKAEGEKWLQNYAMSDPAAEVRSGLIEILSGRFAGAAMDVIQDSLAEDDLENLGKNFGQVAVLDFKTDSWRLQPGPMTASLRVLYGVRARVLFAAENRVLWQGYCFYDGKDSMATVEQLQANSGTLLREKMSEAATSCAKILGEQLAADET
jgi:hypothetical protein